MTRRIYWGIATLIILLIGVSTVLMMQNTDTESERFYKQPTAEQVDQARQQAQDAIDQSKKKLPSIAEVDRPSAERKEDKVIERLVPEVAIVKSDEGLLNTAELNFVKSFELPTDIELARYSKNDIDELESNIHEIYTTIESLSDHYEDQIRLFVEAEYSTDYSNPMRKELRDRRKELEANYRDLGSERRRLRKEIERFRQYTRSI